MLSRSSNNVELADLPVAEAYNYQSLEGETTSARFEITDRDGQHSLSVAVNRLPATDSLDCMVRSVYTVLTNDQGSIGKKEDEVSSEKLQKYLPQSYDNPLSESTMDELLTGTIRYIIDKELTHLNYSFTTYGTEFDTERPFKKLDIMTDSLLSLNRWMGFAKEREAFSYNLKRRLLGCTNLVYDALIGAGTRAKKLEEEEAESFVLAYSNIEFILGLSEDQVKSDLKSLAHIEPQLRRRMDAIWREWLQGVQENWERYPDRQFDHSELMNHCILDNVSHIERMGRSPEEHEAYIRDLGLGPYLDFSKAKKQ